MVQQSRTFYNGNRAVAFATFQRFDDDTTTLGALDATNSYATASAVWYDAAGRQTHTANFGREDVLSPIDVAARYMFDEDGNLIDADADGLPDIAEGAPLAPNSSDNYIVSQPQYNPAGQAYRGIDNLGRITQTEFDLLGRLTRAIENYVDGVVSETEPSDTDRVTQRIYDSAGRLAILRALNPKGSGNGVEQQDTRYLYENPLNGNWVTSTIYPDSTDTDSTGTDQVKVTYDRIGRQTSVTDQRGVVHTHQYDSGGQLTADVVTTCPAGVDGAIRAIVYTYDDTGRLTSVTSYDDPAERGASHVANQIVYAFDTWGNVAQTWQSHDGPVDNDGLDNDETPSVIYTYETGAVGGAAKYIRLAGITYPDGRVVSYSYGSAGGIHDILSRVAAITEGSATYAEYQYLGAGTITAVTYPGVAGNMTLDYDLAGGNVLDGLDRFGRIVEQTWTVNGQPVDSYSYTYDRNSNRLTRKNNLNSSLSETYAYDGLNRLVDTDRGEGQQQVAFQSWNLDQLGNWTSFCGPIQYPNPQTRTHDDANQIMAIDGSGAQVAYDAAGNMTRMPSALNQADTHHALYDAWNRMTAVWLDDGDGTFEPTGENADTLIASYEYDGQRRRIDEVIAATSETRDTFFNEAWQVLEVRVDGGVNPQTQYVWDLRYIDAPAVRFYDANTDADYADPNDNILYYTNDANFNVTALTSSAGVVVERNSYESYGKTTFHDANWSHTLGTDGLPNTADDGTISNVNNNVGFTGARKDAETGLNYMRWRYDHPTLGRFLSNAPVQSGVNLYAYCSHSPGNTVDFTGLWGEEIHLQATATLAGYAAYILRNPKDHSTRNIDDLIGAYDNQVDLYNDPPIVGGGMLLYALLGNDDMTTWLMEAVVLASYMHFPGAIETGKVVGGNRYARQEVDAGIKECNLLRFGEGLHQLQDSWSHAGTTGTGPNEDAYPYKGIIGHSRERGGWNSPAADNPSYWPLDAQKTLMATYDALLTFRKECQCIKKGPFAGWTFDNSTTPAGTPFVHSRITLVYPVTNEERKRTYALYSTILTGIRNAPRPVYGPYGSPQPTIPEWADIRINYL